MFYSDKVDVRIYTELMEQQKRLNADWLSLRQSREYKLGLVLNEVVRDVKGFHFSDLRSSVNRWMRGSKTKKMRSSQDALEKQTSANDSMPDYFSEERVAIYTAIFGPYDKVAEPYCRPDNCDYYIFTDQKVNNDSSAWIKRAAELPELDGLSNAQKNRYLKMHPHKLFPDYKYSIYVDGNVLIISDLTEYVNKLNTIGLGLHTHDARSCAYAELAAIEKSKRETSESVKRHREHLKAAKMPKNYGLLQCNVIAREHHNKTCISIMEQWWEEYMQYTKRDQVSLPYVLYKQNIRVKEVGVLGTNVYTNPSFRILTHK